VGAPLSARRYPDPVLLHLRAAICSDQPGLRQKIPDAQCGYRMLHRELIPHMLGGAHRFEYETEALIIASRKGYRIESVPITTVCTDQVSKIHPARDSLRFFKLMRRYNTNT